MKTLVAVTNTGELCCLTPLYSLQKGCEEMGLAIGQYQLFLVNPRNPLAYVLDAGDRANKQFSSKGPVLLAAHFIEPQVEIVGDL